MSDEDWMHNKQDDEKHEGSPNISGRLLQEGDIKADRPQADVRLIKPIDCFVLLNQHKYLNNLEKGKDIKPKTTQPLKYKE